MATRGGLMMGAAQLVRSVLQFLSVVVLARLLQPGDFGLVAAVSPLTSFVVLFQDLGLQQMLVQRKAMTPAVVSYVFWITAATGVACAVAVVLLSPCVAWFYGDVRLQSLTAVAGVVVLAGSLSAAPMGMLNREMRFRAMAGISVGAAATGLTVALLTAWLGGRYWALMLSPAVTAVVTLAAAWRVSRFAPGPPRRAPESGLLSFGANLTGSAVMNYFARNLDNILVGRTLGSTALGYYDQAYKLLLFPLYLASNPLGQVMIPLLSRIQEDKSRLRSAYLRVVTQLMLILIPGIAAVTITAPDVVGLLLGARWLPVAPIFAWLGLAGLIQPLTNSIGWLFVSQARTGTLLRWTAFSSAIAVTSFVIGLPYGAVGVAAAYAISEYIRTPMLYILTGRVGPVSAGDLLRVQVPALVAAAATYALSRWGATDLLHLQGVPRIGLAVAVSYTLTAALIAMSAGGRAAIGDGAGLVFSALGRSRSLEQPGAR